MKYLYQKRFQDNCLCFYLKKKRKNSTQNDQKEKIIKPGSEIIEIKTIKIEKIIETKVFFLKKDQLNW